MEMQPSSLCSASPDTHQCHSEGCDSRQLSLSPCRRLEQCQPPGLLFHIPASQRSKCQGQLQSHLCWWTRVQRQHRHCPFHPHPIAPLSILPGAQLSCLNADRGQTCKSRAIIPEHEGQIPPWLQSHTQGLPALSLSASLQPGIGLRAPSSCVHTSFWTQKAEEQRLVTVSIQHTAGTWGWAFLITSVQLCKAGQE